MSDWIMLKAPIKRAVVARLTGTDDSVAIDTAVARLDARARSTGSISVDGWSAWILIGLATLGVGHMFSMMPKRSK